MNQSTSITWKFLAPEPEVGVQTALYPRQAHPRPHVVRDVHECRGADDTRGNRPGIRLAGGGSKGGDCLLPDRSGRKIKEDFEREERIMEATGMNDPGYKYGGRYRVLSPQERARLGI